MKRNTYYLAIALVAFIEVALFWWCVEIGDPLFCEIGIILGIVSLYLGRKYVDEVIEDERTRQVNGITAIRTLQISWIGLFLFTLWIIIDALSEWPSLYARRVGILGFRILFLLCAVIILYVALSFYYNKKYGA
jgi:uncharacterized membrane protein